MRNYTTEDLIQYLYNETTPDKSEAIARALETEYSLKEKYEALQDSRQGLDTIVASPRPQTIMAILNYARNSVEVEQQ